MSRQHTTTLQHNTHTIVQGATTPPHSPPTTNTTPHKRNKGAGQYKRGQDDARGDKTIRQEGSNPNTGHHNSTPPTIQHGHHTNKTGDTTHQTGGTASHYPPFNAMPPHPAMPPHHPRQPHPPPRRGGNDWRIPHHTNSTHTTHHTPHTTPSNEQYTTRSQY
jgi:hypothetical protein